MKLKRLRIIATQYSLQTKSLEIYVAGCKGAPHCKGCHNPETWDFNQGEEYSSSIFLKIRDKVRSFPNLVENIMIFGGEPLDSDLGELLFELSILKLPIWIFTHYNINEVPEYVKSYCEYIKCGRYIDKLKSDDNIQYNIKLATTNQHIYKKGKDY